MNSEFPRIITLLRKEKKISQKQAASDLGISQSLLSHYEKGIRECGLEFLVKAADYYSVSCDYLLGRSPEPTGNTLTVEDIPEQNPNQKEGFKTGVAGSILATLNKKLILNSVQVLFSELQKTKCDHLIKEISLYIMLSVYKMFRIVYSSNSKNDSNFFMIPEISASKGADSAMAICEANAQASACGYSINGKPIVKPENAPSITSAAISEEYPAQASSILNVIKNSESRIQIINNSQK